MLLRLIRALAARGWPGAAQRLLQLALCFAPRDTALLREALALCAKLGNHQQLAAICRRLLAVCADDAVALETLAVLELSAGNNTAARDILDTAHRLDRLGGLRYADDALIDPARARSEGVYVAVLHNVEVETADWSILDGGRVYNTEAHNRALRKSPHVQGRASPHNDAYIFRLPAVTQTIEQPCVHLGGDHNYCHWITRNLVKLGLLEGTPHETLPLLVNADLRDYQREFLELMSIPAERLIPLARPSLVHLHELVVPTNLTNHVKMGIGTRWLRRRLAHCMDDAPPCERLFVSRRDARVRRLINEAAVEAALAPLGFTTIVPGEMTVREQIRRFSRAAIIVGAHGAAFGNLVFAPPGARVLEINSTFKAHIPDFTVLARICGLEFASVISDDYDFTRPEPYQADTDFAAGVDEVLATLRRHAPAAFA
jgi:capsular polysaccharide biosynthesis protein